MYPYLHIILPSYGVLAFIGFFLALMLLYFRKDKYQVDFTTFLKIFVSGAIGLIIGSKVLFAITQIPWLIENFTLLNALLLIPQSGYVFYGGLIGTILGVWLYVIKTKCCKTDAAFNMIAPAIPLFHCFGRIGCFLAGCCYGKSFHTPVSFLGIITFNRVPTQLIESLYELVLFVLCLVVEKVLPKVRLIMLYLPLYAVFRFIIEFFRGDTVRGFLLGLSTSQWVSLMIIIALLVIIIKEKKVNIEQQD
ncbi:MAG: prolipoprotein diacylglyceryl transferase [Ruminococcus sp.]|nr:prolipoprotein diacylglyceryl transferase [Ruminococcus sp.]